MGIVMLDDNEYKDFLHRIGLQQFAYAIPAEIEILMRQECNEVFTTRFTHYNAALPFSEIHYKGNRLGKLCAVNSPYIRNEPPRTSFRHPPVIFDFSTYSDIKETMEYRRQFDIIANREIGSAIPYEEWSGDLVITSHLGEWILTTTLEGAFITEIKDYMPHHIGFSQTIINVVYRLRSDHVPSSIKFDIDKAGITREPKKQEVKECKPSSPTQEPFKLRTFLQKIFGISNQ